MGTVPEERWICVAGLGSLHGGAVAGLAGLHKGTAVIAVAAGPGSAVALDTVGTSGPRRLGAVARRRAGEEGIPGCSGRCFQESGAILASIGRNTATRSVIGHPRIRHAGKDAGAGRNLIPQTELLWLLLLLSPPLFDLHLDIDIHTVFSIITIFIYYLTFTQGGISDQVHFPDLRAELPQESIVSHPVSEQYVTPSSVC